MLRKFLIVAVAVAGLGVAPAVAASASSTGTGGATSVSAQRGIWFTYSVLILHSDCRKTGQWLVDIGRYDSWFCYPNSEGRWELRVFDS